MDYPTPFSCSETNSQTDIEKTSRNKIYRGKKKAKTGSAQKKAFEARQKFKQRNVKTMHFTRKKRNEMQAEGRF